MSAREATRIVQIVPSLGGLTDGVADYAGALGKALELSASLKSRYLCARFDGTGAGAAMEATLMNSRSADELLRALEGASTVLLHYVNYGYAERGCPFWLIGGLKAWKERDPGARLITMFHELFAFGPPWRSSFWLSPLQRHLAATLCSISSDVITNREQSARWLRRSGPGSPDVAVFPVFSSIGEPETVPGWSVRAPQMVVAGRTGSLDRAYGECRDQLVAACRALEIGEIVDIGSRSDPVPSKVGDIPVTTLGHLSPTKARAVLCQARAGFLDYPSDFLGKSTVFAAYAAHGLVPVVSRRRGGEETGLQEGINYWVPAVSDCGMRDFEAIAKQARAWYSGHRLEIQAQSFARRLQSGGRS